VPSITLTAPQFLSIASTLVAAAAVKEITPVIISAHVTVEGNELTAVATDRYRVARSVIAAPATGDFAVTIPRAFLEGAAKAIRALKLPAREPMVELEVEGDAITVRAPGTALTAEAVKGNYPPVGRLFPEEDKLVEIGSVSLNAQYVADAGKLTHSALSDPKLSPIRLRFTEHDSARGMRPGPVLITRKLGDAQPGEVLEYLLQPNLMLA
jgi:DNA polymerase III sliding clamp (beta) subunit (PCNA family)